VEVIEHTLKNSRSVWNYALRERKDWINFRKCSLKFCSLEREYIIPTDEPYPSYQRQAKSLTEEGEH
jgi:putative transposase